MAKKNVKKKTVLNKKGLFFLLFLFVLVLLFNSYSLLNKFVQNKKVNEKEYSSSGSIIYSVNVDKNKFIGEPSLESGRSYITGITKGLNMTFDYEYKSDKVLPLKYDYNIKATLYGLYNEDPTSETNPVLWNKEYIIKESTGILSTNADKLSLVENFNIDIRAYITEISKFVEYFQIPTISYVKIEMPIDIYGNDGTYSVSEKYILSAKINIEDKVFIVEQNDLPSEKKFLSVSNTELETIDYLEISIYLLGFLVSLVGFLIVIKKIVDYQGQIDYEDKLEKIKSDYSEIIIITNSMIDTENLKIISIMDFEELLNLAANLSSPIMAFENTRETKFYVIKNEILYLFILKRKDYSKK